MCLHSRRANEPNDPVADGLEMLAALGVLVAVLLVIAVALRLALVTPLS